MTDAIFLMFMLLAIPAGLAGIICYARPRKLYAPNTGAWYVRCSDYGRGGIYHSLLCGHAHAERSIKVKTLPSHSRPCKHCKGKPFQLEYK